MICQQCLLSRRGFLKAGLVVGCSLFVPTPLLAAAGVDAEERARRVLEFRAMLPDITRLLTPILGETMARKTAGESALRYEALLPVLPDVGGAANRNYENLFQAAWLIAFSQSLKDRGQPPAVAGRLLYDLFEQDLAATPAQTLRQQGEAYFAEKNYTFLREWAQQTQQRRYPDDWVARVVFGNGKDFDAGHDYSQCGAVQLFRAHGETVVAPYFCLNDFTLSRYQGTGLRRVHTIAQGDACCDFRYAKGREVVQSWDTETPRFAGSVC